MRKEIWWFFEFSEYVIDKEKSYISFLNKNIINWKWYDFYLDGRNAIYSLLDKLWNNKEYLLPAYLCDSVLEPFNKKQYKYNFYSIFEKEKILTSKWNIIFIINYFWENFLSDFELNKILENNIVIIDISHDIFNKQLLSINNKNLYLIWSLRKILPLYWWGIVIWNWFNIDKSFENDNMYLIQTSILKRQYLNWEINDKYYLDLYNKIEEDRINNITWKNISLSDYCFLKNANIELLLNKREKNFKYLFNLIKQSNVNNILYQKSNFNYSYLVIKLKNENQRNSLRQYLIKNNIYSPIHWQLPNILYWFIKEKELSKQLLSIPIDHRYSTKDMDYIFKLLIKFYE